MGRMGRVGCCQAQRSSHCSGLSHCQSANQAMAMTLAQFGAHGVLHQYPGRPQNLQVQSANIILHYLKLLSEITENGPENCHFDMINGHAAADAWLFLHFCGITQHCSQAFTSVIPTGLWQGSQCSTRSGPFLGPHPAIHDIVCPCQPRRFF